MKKVWLVSLALLAHTAIGAEEKILFDFENYAIGETVPMNDIFNGSNTESRATVVADPINAQNKVLHITNKSWNTTVEFTLDQMTAEEITGDYQYLAFDLYRPSTDGEYKQFSARIGADTIYADAVCAAGNQGNLALQIKCSKIHKENSFTERPRTGEPVRGLVCA